MVYLSLNTLLAYFPANTSASVFGMHCTNQITHKTLNITFDLTGHSHNGYYAIDFEHNTMPQKLLLFENGQYDYELYGNTETAIVERGILQFGEYVPDVSDYTKSEQIIQYNG